MKKYVILFGLCTLFVNMSQSQNTRMDSLLKLLRTAREDTNKVRILYQLSDASSDDSIGLYNAVLVLRLSEKLNYLKGIGDGLNNIGYFYSIQSSYDTALSYFNRSLVIRKRIGERTAIGESYNSIGLLHYYKGDVGKAMNYFELAKMETENLTSLESKKVLGKIFGNIGMVYEMQGNNFKAHESFLLSLGLGQEVKDDESVANALQSLGKVYYNNGNISKAYDYNLRSLRLREEIGNKVNIAYSLNALGFLSKKQGDKIRAKEYYKKSLDLQRITGDREGMSDNYIAIGTLYDEEGDFDQAVEYLLKGLKIAESIGSPSNIGNVLNNLGAVYKKQKKFQEAMDSYKKGFELYKKLKNKKAMCTGLNNISNIYLNLNQLIPAEAYSKESLSLALDIGFPEDIRNARHQLSDIYAAGGKFKQAYLMHVEFKKLSDSLVNVATRKSVLKKEMQYDFDKKEALMTAEQGKKDALAKAEIRRQTLKKNSTLGGVGITAIFSLFLVSSYNRRRKTSFEKQVSEVEMKALRSQMNPHFIFNSLHSIKNYIMENEKENAAEYLSKFASLMRLILENSRQQEVPLENDLSALELYMELEALRFECRFQYEIEVDEVINKEETLIPPMLLQPFVENSIIHGISSKTDGKIKIKIQKEHNSLRCTIEDNGIGREQSVVVETGESKKRESLGMKITLERLNIINQMKKVNAVVTIFDLKDTGNNSLGLKVELLLPFETTF